MAFHTSPFILSQRSINKFDVKPTRTSYASMSSWFFIDDDLDSNKEDEANTGLENLNKHSIIFPPIAKNKLPSERNEPHTQTVGEFLMHNWKHKSDETNKSTFEVKNPDRKGRSGGGGAWFNISHANKHDGNKLLFVNGGAIREPFEKIELKKKISELQKPKLNEPESRRLGIQTRQGVDQGNWNIIR